MKPSKQPAHLRHIRERNDLRDKGPDFRIGEDAYSEMDRALLLGAFAKTAGVGYINLIDLEIAAQKQRGWEGRRHKPAQAMTEQLSASPSTVIVDGIHHDVSEKNSHQALEWAALNIAALAKREPGAIPRRMIVPIALAAQGDKPGHMIVSAVEWDPKARHFIVSLFEQHALWDGEERNYGEDLAQVGATWKAFLGITAKTEVRVCAQHFCREKNVCSIVSLETVKTLARSKKSPHVHAADPGELAMDWEEVEAAHASNAKLLSRLAAPAKPARKAMRGHE